MTSKNYLYYFLIVCLCMGNVGLFTACSEDKQETWSRPEVLTEIDAFIKEGILLQSWEEKGASYLLSFENEKLLEFPTDQIREIRQDANQWSTIITLTNGQEYLIPTIGKSIDKFVKEIKLNPSGYNPLAAFIRMEVPAKGCFKIKVYAKEGAKASDLEHTFDFVDNYVQDVTVLGLYENHTNRIDLTYMNKEGIERGHTTIEIQTPPLGIKRLPTHCILKMDAGKMEPGMTMIACPGESETDTSLPYMVDIDGEVRWVLDWEKSEELTHIGMQCGLHRLKNGNYVVGDFNNSQIVEVDLLGNIVHRVDIGSKGYGFHHEVYETERGTILVAANKQNAKLTNGNSRIMDHIIELNLESGGIVQEWDMATMMDTTRYGRVDQSIPGSEIYGQTASNWLHNNGVREFNGNILATARWQGVLLFTPKGELKWVIAPHNKWREEYRHNLLQPLDKNGQPITDIEVLEGRKSHPDFDWVWGVHCPVAMPNGQVLVFDNGYCRNNIARQNNDPLSYSRAVAYKIDEQNMTIQQMWSYGQERGLSCYSPATSSVQYLKQSGHILFCPSTGSYLQEGKAGGRVIEIDPKTNEVIFEMEVYPQSYIGFHRANRISLYPEGL
ncbi:aryl-sulfate sulfotransferase [Parabacteroides goldsteinii]|uniref:aryl-sulfate sulfotransferase n=1 Tax=Parabacteroides goldsteinii TaxID=328812 RepID=UPI001E65C9DB|nr:aryl-sulfate sulfotransferase [Parabacteroides goldsteinii]